MSKFALVPLVLALLPLKSAQASTMSLSDRVAVARKFEKVTPFLKEKYLPASFVKELEKNLQSPADKAELKKIQSQWSKHYSKKVDYALSANAVEVRYQKMPVISMKVTSLKPYTVQVNGGSEMIIRSNNFFADMRAAVHDAGFDFGPKKSKKSAFFQLLLPEAYAADPALPLTVENSIYLMGLATFNQAGDNLFPASRMTEHFIREGNLYAGMDRIVCKGSDMVGHFKISDTMTANMDIVRGGRVRIEVDGKRLIGEPGSTDATEVCQLVQASNQIVLSNPAGQALYDRHLQACRFIKNARPASGMQCSELAPGGQAPLEVLQADCAAMKRVGLSANFNFKLCKNESCSETADVPQTVSTLSQLTGWEAFVPAQIEASAKIQNDFAKEISEGLITKDDKGWRIVPPNRLSGRKTAEFNAAVAAIPKELVPDSSKPYFDFRYAAAGLAGMLDCCYDSECKQKVWERGNVDVTPIESNTVQ